MVKLCLLGVLGVVIGFAATAWHEPAYACSCVDFNAWKLTLVDASPEVDRAAWQVDGIYFNMSSERSTTLHSNSHFELTMENK
jgi:hypothetical protein